MSGDYFNRRCFACNNEEIDDFWHPNYTGEVFHEHHIVPQAFGGEKLKTVLLCHSCHVRAHNANVGTINEIAKEVHDYLRASFRVSKSSLRRFAREHEASIVFDVSMIAFWRSVDRIQTLIDEGREQQAVDLEGIEKALKDMTRKMPKVMRYAGHE